MATSRLAAVEVEIDYPTSDGRPMAETEWHRLVMTDTIQTLVDFQADDPDVYTSGNMLLYYVRGDRRKHVAPDVFTVRGIEKKLRAYYLLWEEGKGPDAIIEATSKSTRREDLGKKFTLYRDVLRVKEYFLFDPLAEYLDPPLRGFRLRGGQYVRIRPVDGRLPSQVLGLHLERDGWQLRLWDPGTGRRLLTRQEKHVQAEAAQRLAQEELRRAQAEIDLLRRQLEALRRSRTD